MPGKYDVIIIGGGLGGLSSAAWLAKNGLSVLLLEKRELPGGCATGFIREDSSSTLLSTSFLEWT
ncbi:MAG: FAD-dependent oxidoreductase [Candidatus Freyrarchaeum guaymaensis]